MLPLDGLQMQLIENARDRISGQPVFVRGWLQPVFVRGWLQPVFVRGWLQPVFVRGRLRDMRTEISTLFFLPVTSDHTVSVLP